MALLARRLASPYADHAAGRVVKGQGAVYLRRAKIIAQRVRMRDENNCNVHAEGVSCTEV